MNVLSVFKIIFYVNFDKSLFPAITVLFTLKDIENNSVKIYTHKNLNFIYNIIHVQHMFVTVLRILCLIISIIYSYNCCNIYFDSFSYFKLYSKLYFKTFVFFIEISK